MDTVPAEGRPFRVCRWLPFSADLLGVRDRLLKDLAAEQGDLALGVEDLALQSLGRLWL